MRCEKDRDQEGVWGYWPEYPGNWGFCVMRWKHCVTAGLGGSDHKLTFRYGISEMPNKFHRRDVKWTVRYMILQFTGEVQLRIVLVEDIIAQNT